MPTIFDHTQTIHSIISRTFQFNPECSQNQNQIDPNFSQLATKKEMIVIIDSGVADSQHLINGIVAEARVLLLDATQDGIEQITQALRENTDITEIHLISHGSPGRLQLGNSHLSLDTLEQYGDQLKSWFPAECLTPSLLLYGCNVAAGDAGEEFIEKLHHLTGADIAASTTKTGHAALGGDWNLEVQTREFDVAIALSAEARAAYRFVFPEGITNLITDPQPGVASNQQGVDEDGDPITINFGQGNDIVITGFTNADGDQFIAGDALQDFQLRRVDNAEVQGRRQLIWFGRESETDEVLNLNASFPNDQNKTLMEEALSGDIINRGTDNVFANTGNRDGNNNNIERVDYIATGGLSVPEISAEDLAGLGFIILERINDTPDSLKIAAITGLDVNGDPSAFGDLVDLNPGDWGESDIALNTEVLLREDAQVNDPDGELINTADPEGNVAAIYVSYQDLGLEAGESFFGYALFPPDIDASNDLVGLTDFPTNTGDRGAGGLDLIAGGVVFAREGLNLPPIARPDTAVTDFGVPVNIDVLDGDDNGEGADSDPDSEVEGDPDLSIVPDSITTPTNGTVTIDDNGTPGNLRDNFLVYTPNPDFPPEGGEDSFTYIITDGQDNSEPAEVTITVNAPALTTVGGNVFSDTNGNDVFNPGAGEPPLPAITVNLIDETGTPVDTVETSPDGVYLFENVVPGVYTVQVDVADPELPAGATLGTLNDLPVTAVAGEPNNNNNFGFDLAPVTTTVSGTVFSDSDGLDDLTPGELLLPTISVNLIDEAGTVAGTAETDGNGFYQFDDVVPGNYTVQVDIADPELPAGATPGTGNDLPITVVAEPVTGINFGFDIPPVTTPDTATTTLNTPVPFNILENDTDDGSIDPATVDLDPSTPAPDTTREVPGEGTYSVDPTGEVTFTPEPGFTGPSTINYTVQDNNGTPSAPTPITVTVTAPETTTVSGTVFGDSDGLDDLTPGEPPLETITVNLIDADGNTVDTVATSADGSYQFDGVVPGEYTVQVDTTDTELPSGATLGTDNDIAINVAANQPVDGINFGFDIPPVTTPDTATTTPDTPVPLNILENDTDDGSIDPATVDLDPSTPAPDTTREVPGVGTYSVDPTGEVTFTPEPGFTGESTINYTVQDNTGTPSAPTPITVTVTAPDTTTVSGTVFGDSDGLDDLTPGEPPLETITVNLIDADGNTVDTVATSADGSYQFDGVVPGEYTVQVDTTDTELPSGATLGTDNDIAINVAANQPVDGINFGFDIPPVTTPDTATTTPDTPVPLNILENDTDDGSIDPATVDLDPSTPAPDTTREVPGVGTYSVDPTTGLVTFDPEPEFIGESTINYTVQDNTGTPSAPTPITVTVTAPTGFPVSGSVFSDLDNGDSLDPGEPPLPGITVNLLNPDGTPVVDGNGDPLTTQTDANGDFVFPDVLDGQYLIQVDPNDPDLPAGSTLGTPNDLPVTVAGSPVEGNNFGFDPAALGFPVSGSVFVDEDGTDTRTPDEPPLAGITVNLLNPDGTPVVDGNDNPITATTDPNGNYTFPNVPDGNYLIAISENNPNIPDGFTLGTPETQPVVVAGTPSGGINFGFDPAPIGFPISGSVYSDFNGSDTPTPDEPRIPGITVNLLDNEGNVFRSTTTDENGNYVFNNILDGQYTIQVDASDPDIPAGFTLGTPNDLPVTVAGQFVGGRNFGFDPTPDNLPVSGTVFTDVNNDGSPTPNEPRLDGITVNLLDEDGNPVLDLGGNPITTETDPNGNYVFDNVPPGDYLVQVDETDPELPNGTTLGTSNNQPITVTTEPVGGINFGFDPAALGVAVSGSVFTDDDGDDLEDPEEPPLAGITVNLVDSNGEVVDTATTDPNGNYAFNNIPDGVYTVEVDPEDSDIPPGFTLGTPPTLPVTVAGTPVDGQNFGFDPAPVGQPVSGTVFNDLDGEDDLDPNEPPLPGITVNLLSDGNIIDSTTTDADGNYVFNNVPDGVYTVEVDENDPDLPAEAALGTPNNLPVTVAGEPVEGNNFGFDPTPTGFPVSGNIFTDVDGGDDLDPGEPPLAGITVNLLNPDGTPVLDDQGNPITATTDPNGNYTFPNIPDGTYSVEVDQNDPDLPDGFSLGTPNNVAVTVAGEPVDGPNFGFDPTPTGFPVSGNIFTDVDGGGDLDPGEPPLAGITVNLLNPDGTPVLDDQDNPITATTDPNGNYTFPNIPDGTYSVEVDQNDPDLPDGFSLGTPNNVAVTVAGEPVDGPNFGFNPAPFGFPISGSVYRDFDGSDNFSLDEPRIPGITVNLLDSQGNVVRSTTTNENGNYVFNNVLDGQYTIQVDPDDPDLPDGFSLGTPNDLPVTVAGAFVGGFNFGFDPTPGNLPVSGTVFTDVNSDGSPTPNEPRLDGITVNLLNPDETPVVDSDSNPITTETDPNGNYVFDNVPPGDYLVQVDETDPELPNGTTLGTGNNQPITVATEPVGGVNFGFNPAAPGVAVSGSVFTDLNGDDQDTDEPPLAGITVNLVDSTGEVVDTAVTAPDGNYVFNNIPDGVYTVEVDPNDTDLPAGFTLGTPPTLPVTVAGTPVDGQNFGFDPAPAGQPITGTVFNDVNGDDQDTDEPPLPGITVNLLSDGNIIDTTTTDPDGNYVFNNVPNGEYTLEVDVDDEDLPTGSNIGTPNPLTVTVAGTPLVDQNFGFDITLENRPPEATDETVNANFNEPVSFSLTDNVSDPDGDETLVLTSIDLDPGIDGGIQNEITVPDQGTFVVDDEASVTFTPVDGFIGTVTTPYTVQDNEGATSDPANITVTVSSDANQAPVAQDVTSPTIVNTDAPLLLPLTPDQDFSDTDGTVETITINLPSSDQGTLFLNGTPVTDPSEVEGLPVDQLPNITFAPNPLFAGTASFTYTVTDDDGAPSNTGNIIIPVVAPIIPFVPPVDGGGGETPQPSTNQPPVAESFTTTITNDGDPSPLPTLPATDPDGTITRYTITGLPAEGTLLVDGQEITSLDQVQDLTPEQIGQLTFDPADNFSGEVLLSFTATDDDGAVSNSAVATIVVSEDTSIPRGDVIDDGGCDCPPLPEVPVVPLPERPDFTPSDQSGLISGTEADDNIAGSNANDVIIALGGDDVIEGFDGGDVIFSGDGNDLQFGDEGNDVLFGELGNDSLIAGNGGTGPAPEGVDGDIVFGNQGNDLLQGGPGEDLLFSGKGDDFSYAGENDDILWGDLGNDTLYGDEGNDTIFGDIDNENLLEPERGLAGMQDLILGGAGNDSLDGNRSNDTLSGGAGDDTVRGGKENDLIYGDEGDDVLFGELGSDHLCGNEGNDTMFGDVLASFASGAEESDTLCGEGGNDLLITNVGSDKLCGGADNDSLYGGKGNDTLAGEAGDDWLFGDDGDDEVSGGSGSDRFILFSDDGNDTILDFQLGQDLIALGGGLTFEQLTITQSGTSTIISLEGQQLATLNDVQGLDSDDFTTF